VSAGRPVDGDAALAAAIAAFQRRFRPARIDGVPDHETTGLIAAAVPLFEGT
jgi:N-acetyl-anhydromuramyl-L-alanine amidase AmpD